MKRYHGTAALEWVAKHQPLVPGTIIRWRENIDNRYSEYIRTSFCNHATRKDILHRGTTHVAVGFNDLGILLSCDLREAPGGKKGHDPLRFIGIDASPFSVAKSLVLAEMLGTESVPLEHCVQVWYSATCSKAASKNFARAASQTLIKVKHEQVRSYIFHWSAESASSAVPLTKARKMWLDTREGRNGTDIMAVKRHEDQLKMCHYLITGDILDEEKPEVGNPAMWSMPPSSPPISIGESAFNAVEIDDLAVAEGKDILHRLVQELLRRLRRLRQWLLTGVVEVDLRCDVVDLEAAIVPWIAQQHPWTMSWSNVLDYIPPGKFHQLARMCSIQGDTVHYGYSMNWVVEVFGTCIMDFDGNSEAVSQVIKASHEMCETTERIAPAGKLLLLPPHDTPINVTGHLLAMLLHKKWTTYFFSQDIAGDVQVGVASMQTYNPLATNANCLSMTWTYDPENQLQDQNGRKREDPLESAPNCPTS